MRLYNSLHSRLILLHFCLMLLCVTVSETTLGQTIDSSYQLASSGASSVEAITTDKSGNVYIAGYFKDSIWINETHVIKGTPTLNLMYFVGYTPGGDVLFSKTLNTGEQAPIQLETDDSGHIYIGTLFRRSKLFLDAENQNHLVSSGYGTQAFIIKVNKSGDHLWHMYSNGTKTKTEMKFSEFTLTSYGQLIWIGSIQGSIGIHTSNRYNYSGFSDIGDEQANRTGSFLLRTNPNATTRFPKVIIGNSSAIVRATTVAEKNGNIIFGGQLNGTVDFDPSTSTKEIKLSGKAFYCSLDTNMNLNWVKTSTLHRFDKITINAYDQIKCYGSYAGVGSSKFEMASLTMQGIINWEYSESFSSVALQINDCHADKGGNIFVCGTFAGSGDFDPTSASRYGGAGNNASFVVKYDSSGKAIWLITGTGSGSYTNRGAAVHLSNNNQLYWGGTYSRNFNFSGNSAQNLPYTTYVLGYIAHLTECKSLQAYITPADTTVCENTGVTLNIVGAESVLWLDESNKTKKRFITPLKSSSFSAEVSNDSGCYKTISAYIEVQPSPEPVISFMNNECQVTGNWKLVTWFLDNQKVIGENGNAFRPKSNGKVYCTVQDSLGCVGESNTLDVTLVSAPKMLLNELQVYYSNGALVLKNDNHIEDGLITIYGQFGQQIWAKKTRLALGHNQFNVDIPPSVYMVRVMLDSNVMTYQKILVTD